MVSKEWLEYSRQAYLSLSLANHSIAYVFVGVVSYCTWVEILVLDNSLSILLTIEALRAIAYT